MRNRAGAHAFFGFHSIGKALSVFASAGLIAGCSNARYQGPTAVGTSAQIQSQAMNFAPISLVQKTSRSTFSASMSLNFPSANTSGNLILVQIVFTGVDQVKSVTDSLGNTYQAATNQSISPGGNSEQIFYAANIKPGTNKITVSTVDAGAVIVYAQEYSGIDPSSPIDAVSSSTGSDPAISSGSLSTSLAGDLIYGGILADGSVQGVGAEFTSLGFLQGNLGEYLVSGSPGSYEAAATGDGQGWAAQAIALKPAPIAVPSPSPSASPSISVPETFVQSSSGSAFSSSASLSFNSATRTGDTVLVQAVYVGTGGIVSVADSQGNTYLPATQNSQSGGGNSEQIFYTSNIKGGADSVTVQTANSSNVILFIQEFSGIDVSNPIDATASASGSGPSVSSGNLNAHYAGEVLFGGVLSDGSIQSAGAGFQNVAITEGNLSEYEIASASGTYAASATNDDSSWVAQLVALRPEGSGGTSPTPSPSPSQTISPSPTPSPSGSLASAPWTGVLAPSRAINWSGAGAVIPSGVTKLCATQPANSSLSAINAAIAADAGGTDYCVINLPAGSFDVSGSLIVNYAGKANVILRGAGSNKTFLKWTGSPSTACNGLGSTAICLFNGNSSDWVGTGNSSSWTAGYAPGTTTITLSNVSGLKVGYQIWLQQSDSTSDNGNLFICSTSGSNGDCSQQGAAVGGDGDGEHQMVTVTACGTRTFGADCTSNEVTISSPIYAPNWSASRSPTASWLDTMPLYNFGMENLSVDVSGISTTLMFLVVNSSNIWFDGIRSINGTTTGHAATEHYLLFGANHVTLQNSYGYGSNPQYNGYYFSPSAGSDDCLAQNNITQHLASGFVTQSAVGNVFAYNYTVDNYFGSGWQQCEEFHHSVGDMYNLFEGNVGVCGTDDDIHGTSGFQTRFRNRLSGLDTGTESGAPYDNTHAYFDMAGARFNNLVGNVLGTAGYHSVYDYAATSASDSAGDNSSAIFMFGYSDQNGEEFSTANGFSFNLPNDPSVLGSDMLWGNYDTVTGGVRFNASENGSKASTYPGLSNPSMSLPASFYLSGKPAWWVFPNGDSSTPFPGIGPDVTGGNIANVAGHAYLNPAANCYLNVMHGKTDGSSGPLAFDSSGCYPQ